MTLRKLCMILNNFEPPYGGPELQALNIASKLKEHGHEIFFIAKGKGTAPAQDEVNGIPIYRLNRKGLASIEAAYVLFRLRNNFDIIHVHGVGRLASIAISFSKHFKKTVYIKVTTIGHILKPTTEDLKGLLKRLSPFRNHKVDLLKQANAMIAISRDTRAELINNGFDQNKIIDIPNGVNIKQFYPVSIDEKNLLRKKLGLPENKKIVIFTGKLTKLKGIDTMLAVWSRLKKIQDKAVLVLVGSGQGQRDNLENWIKKYSKENDLSRSVILTGDVRNVNEYLKSADIFLFPSRREGLPNSLMEAMACGLLCIASEISGNMDLITQGKTGYLVPTECIDAWVNILGNSIEDTPQHCGNEACKLIETKYSLDKTVNRLEMLYANSYNSPKP